MFGHLAEDLEIFGIGQPVDRKHPSRSFGEAQVTYLVGSHHRIPNIGAHLIEVEIEAALSLELRPRH